MKATPSRESFHSELPDLNAIVQELGRNPSSNSKEDLQRIRAQWAHYSELLSPETRSALNKLGKHLEEAVEAQSSR